MTIKPAVKKKVKVVTHSKSRLRNGNTIVPTIARKAKYPSAPEYLDPGAIEEWDRLYPLLQEYGLIKDLDHGTFAAYCSAYSLWVKIQKQLKAEVFYSIENDKTPDEGLTQYSRVKRRNWTSPDDDPASETGLTETTDKGNRVRNPLFAMASAAMRDFVAFATELGLTPLARMRVKGEKESTDNPFLLMIAGKEKKKKTGKK